MRVTTICCFSIVRKEEPTAAHYVFAFGGSVSCVCVCAAGQAQDAPPQADREARRAAGARGESCNVLYCNVMYCNAI